jgi:hypothetical protein
MGVHIHPVRLKPPEEIEAPFQMTGIFIGESCQEVYSKTYSV